jgi:acylphosphatase
MTSVHFLVEGTVQGVGFRRFVLHHAHRLHLRGWVTNTDDGSVEGVVQGDVAAITEMETLLRTGPNMSRVTSVTCTDLSDERQWTSFRIL